MKRIVIDTTVIINFFFPENWEEQALKLKKAYLEKKIALCSRDLLLYEFTSALKNYIPIKIVAKDFALAVQTLSSLKMQLVGLGYQDLSDLFNLSNKLNLSVYDCSYILLAKKLRAPLYTADNKLYLASKKIVTSILIWCYNRLSRWLYPKSSL